MDAIQLLLRAQGLPIEPTARRGLFDADSARRTLFGPAAAAGIALAGAAVGPGLTCSGRCDAADGEGGTGA